MKTEEETGMTNLVRYLTVVLDDDVRVDDVESLQAAVKMMKGVLTVELGRPTNTTDYIARMNARQELVSKLLEIIKAY
jgi:hypothetical protein